MSKAKEFAPLMKAIERVLGAIGEERDLEPTLSSSVNDLRKVYQEYRECCCFFAVVVPFEKSDTKLQP